jgi:D-arginine dehydrogenase
MTTVVIGGGIAGVSVAAELANSRDVLLLETEPMLARHTTGRSAAVYLPSYGGPVIRALTAASLARFDPELLRPRSLLWVSTDEDGERHVEETVAAGTAEAVTVARARELCPVLRPDALRSVAFDAGMMDIDAMGLHQHYVRELKARGGRIRMGAPVTALTRDGAGWRITLGPDSLHADELVDAAGAWADQVAALAGVPSIGLTPLKRTIAIAVGGPVDPTWPMVADAAEGFYFRPEGEGVLLSPADETPSEPCDAKPDELDVALAMERVNEVTTLGLRSVRTAWAGLRSFTPGRTPVVGAAPGHPGFHFFAGQGGYGIQIAPALAAAAAAVIRGEAIPADIAVTAEDLRSPLWTA